MHAVVTNVTIGDFDTAAQVLNEQVVPRAKGAPGFVTGYWLRKGSSGLSFIVFESEDAANAAAEQIRSMGVPSDEVTVDSVDVREVVANA